MDQLADVVNLHTRLLDERKKTEARFEPLRCAVCMCVWWGGWEGRLLGAGVRVACWLLQL